MEHNYANWEGMDLSNHKIFETLSRYLMWNTTYITKLVEIPTLNHSIEQSHIEGTIISKGGIYHYQDSTIVLRHNINLKKKVFDKTNLKVHSPTKERAMSLLEEILRGANIPLQATVDESIRDRHEIFRL